MHTAPAIATATAYRWRWFALAALLAAEAMNILDATITQVAAPVIHAGLGGPAAAIPWFSAAYTLPFAVLLITGGRLGDMFGRRRLFLAGVAGFALMSVACACAPATGVLIAARAVQGATAALVIPQTIGLIKAMFDGPDLGRALGWNGPVVGGAAVCGPVVAAVLTHASPFGLSWRAVFLVNVPIAVIILAAGRLLREDRAARRPRLDIAGTLLAVLGSWLIVYPLVEGGSGELTAGAWAAVTAGVCVLAVFAVHQRRRASRGRSPLVEPGLFRGVGFPAMLATATLLFAATTGLTLVVALHVQLGLGAGVLTAGLTLLPWSAGLAIGSWATGAYLLPRYGTRVMPLGLATLLTGTLAAIVVYHVTPPGAYPPALLVALVVCGAGLGAATVPLFTTALSHVRPHETGSAAGLLNAVQQLGATLGTAVCGTVFLTGLTTNAGTAAQHAFGVAAVLLLLTTTAAVLAKRLG